MAITVAILSDPKATDKQKEEAIVALVAQYKKDKNAAGLADLVKKATDYHLSNIFRHHLIHLTNIVGKTIFILAAKGEDC